ncbi:type II secretion system F family protein [Herbaspirillum sp. alder98]|uniref:type II secretion system F family protein n=1 Tax=Herbaspirillum sp. alder98 TaxID=2913096 RepID=UPI001CD880CD|nr:type II secretion system F family protein [Herbaspirillum sp. alder98]MCA1323579.1 type II secretion system F family protein [Herbaspirillum sp. alder98]
MWFKVRALSSDDMITHVTLAAIDEMDARRQAEAQGLRALSIVSTRQGLPGRRSTSGFSVLLFSQELLALLRAGLSIVETLEALHEKEENAGARAVLGRLLLALREGKRFSVALGEQPAVFSALYAGIVQAAEGTSSLPQSLARFVDYQQRIDGIRTKIVSAMIYPLILLLVGGGVTLFLVGYVVPQFAEVYQGAGRNLPWLSQLLLDAGRMMTRHAQLVWVGILLALLVTGVAIYQAIASGWLIKWAGRLPGFGQRLHVYALSRLYLTLGMLLEGGIPVVTALQTTRSVVNVTLQKDLDLAIEAIQSGMPMSTALSERRLTTPVSLRMLRAGERSGELGQMLTQAAAFYDGEIARWIDRFTKVFEPALMTAIGIIVGAIVVLLYIPIFDLAGSLS